jgi:hypothetical protein
MSGLVRRVWPASIIRGTHFLSSISSRLSVKQHDLDPQIKRQALAALHHNSYKLRVRSMKVDTKRRVSQVQLPIISACQRFKRRESYCSHHTRRLAVNVLFDEDSGSEGLSRLRSESWGCKTCVSRASIGEGSG